MTLKALFEVKTFQITLTKYIHKLLCNLSYADTWETISDVVDDLMDIGYGLAGLEIGIGKGTGGLNNGVEDGVAGGAKSL